MKRLIAVSVLTAGVVVFSVVAMMPSRPVKSKARPMAALAQTYIAVEAGPPVQVPRLIADDGSVLAPERLRGHWSVIFVGFTACPMVCPKTLSILAAVARNPESGVASGAMLPVFVSIDPEQDTPARIREYLGHFDHRILGITGTREAIDTFNAEIGAGSKSVGSGIDHSTSLFVLDPEGRLAGILLRPSDPLRIVADLKEIRSRPGR